MSEGGNYTAAEKQELGKNLRELEEKMLGTEGYRIGMRIRALNASFNIFYQNYFILNDVLSEIGKPGSLVSTFAKQDIESLDKFNSTVALVFHNFLAGAKTLVDHTRVFKNDLYKGTDFEREYQNRVSKDFVRSPIVQFVQRLRNYTLHTRLPVTTARIHIKKVGPQRQAKLSGSISLDVGKLREWDGWTAKSREYLDAQGDKVEIKTIADQYFSVIRAFCDWFGMRQSQLHHRELKEFEELQDKFREVRQRWLEAWGQHNKDV
jgi:hypothetical protein